MPHGGLIVPHAETQFTAQASEIRDAMRADTCKQSTAGGHVTAGGHATFWACLGARLKLAKRWATQTQPACCRTTTKAQCQFARGAIIDRAGIQYGAPFCFFTGTGVMVILANSNSLALLAIGIVVFFMCGTALATVVSAEASRKGSRVFARYATAGDLGSAFGPLIGWTAFEFLDTPDLAFTLGAILYSVGLVATTRAFENRDNN